MRKSNRPLVKVVLEALSWEVVESIGVDAGENDGAEPKATSAMRRAKGALNVRTESMVATKRQRVKVSEHFI